MSDIFIVCEWDDYTWGAHKSLCWYEDQAKAEAEASRLEWAKYEMDLVSATEEGRCRPISPDNRKDWTYFVEVLSQGA